MKFKTAMRHTFILWANFSWGKGSVLKDLRFMKKLSKLCPGTMQNRIFCVFHSSIIVIAGFPSEKI